ncbi:isochorismatase family protein [Streptomyces sp. SID8352]|uniref:isochorismatase family protein n=1 Tax=Streptomyces sp. SID8352 TaxID=2690338 RepID=UPI00136DCDC4|nr:isochorismatase family protein [Streptomyces sp. SID8352]MYU22486.1 isochorismatase family protein [Streptomyces sp. SID8352]
MTVAEAGRTALVLIDLQGSNADHPVHPHTTDTVLERCVRLIEAARRAGSTVVHVRTSFLPDESDSLGGRLLTDIERPARPVRRPGWDHFLPGIEPLPTEPVIIKRSWNAFHGSDLDLQLRRRGIDTVVMAGISTGFGVEGTARAAFDHAYNVVFVPEAMSAYTAEQHEHAVRVMFPQLGRVRSLDEVVEGLVPAATAAS